MYWYTKSAGLPFGLQYHKLNQLEKYYPKYAVTPDMLRRLSMRELSDGTLICR